MKEETERVLKQDAAGRVWTPREQREAALEEFERSGLTGAKFAAHIGVKYQTFAGWVRKRRLNRLGGPVTVEGGAGPVRWVEAAVTNPEESAAAWLVVQLPGGARVEIANCVQVPVAAQLLR